MHTADIQLMRSAKNKQVISQFFEALDLQDTERIAQLVSGVNCSFHFPGMPSMDWEGD
jgi:hypothetical protein